MFDNKSDGIVSCEVVNKSIIGIVIVVVLVLGAGGIYLATQKSSTPVEDTQSNLKNISPPPTFSTDTSSGGTFKQEDFQNIKSAHYVSSEPANNVLLSTSPSKVTLNFNFNLTAPSKIQVTKDGSDVTAGTTQISEDKLSMSVPINANQTGNYKVAYTACWPDGSCHNGSFGFSVKLP